MTELELLLFTKMVHENTEAGTRLTCITSDLNKYDEYAVQQINRNIELMWPESVPVGLRCAKISELHPVPLHR